MTDAAPDADGVLTLESRNTGERLQLRRHVTVPAGGSVAFSRGSAHRWWNEGDETLVFEGRASPADDLDRYLQAVFEAFNAGPADRPPLFYMAHVLHRHRKTQIALVVPPLVQRLLFPLVIGVGRLLGKYRGTDWPGCPARCGGAPTPSTDAR